MTRPEDWVAEVLRRVVPDQVEPVSFDEVARLARYERHTVPIRAGIAMLLLASIVVVLFALPGWRRSAPPAIGRPASHLTFQGVTLGVPAGWRQVRYGCGVPPGNHTVEIGLSHSYSPCNGVERTPPARTPTSMVLTRVYGPTWAERWHGRPVTWHGQPAWLAVRSSPGVAELILTLPLLGVSVDARSPDMAVTRALLRLVSPQLVPGLAVPRRASSVFIEAIAGRSARHASVTAPAQVRRILADLRALRPAAFRRSCSLRWGLDTALLTLYQPGGLTRTFAAQLGRCGTVITGTGSAVAVSGRLLTDIRRLVPGSGL